MRKWILRIAVGLLGAVVLLTAALLVGFLRWRSVIKGQLVRESRVIQTARGPVEYAELGQGPAVLVIHGTPGGYDGPLNTLKAIHAEHDGFRYIVPSRPGYLRTPLSDGVTPAQQADLYAALLDALHVRKAAIIAHSGGGPSALQFAIRYPKRCTALVLESALIRAYRGPPAWVPKSRLAGDYRDFRIYVLYLEAAHLLPRAPKLAKHVPAVLAQLRASVPYSLRKTGMENDMLQEARIKAWPLDRIQCPTLILQGTADQSAPLTGAEFAHAQIAGSRLVELPGQGHEMSIWKQTFLHKAIVAFLRKVS